MACVEGCVVEEAGAGDGFGVWGLVLVRGFMGFGGNWDGKGTYARDRIAGCGCCSLRLLRRCKAVFHLEGIRLLSLRCDVAICRKYVAGMVPPALEG